MIDAASAAQRLIEISGELATRGWLRATSGNLSLRDQETGLTYITRSGADKQRLIAQDILTLAADGSVIAGEGQPSFETGVHRAIYRVTQAGAVFHIHTIYNNGVAKLAGEAGLFLHDHEMLKALGHWDEGASLVVPLVPNYADIDQLAEAVTRALNPAVPAVLVRRHGIYAFGDSAESALRHLEAFEFLFEWACLDRLLREASKSSDPLPV